MEEPACLLISIYLTSLECRLNIQLANHHKRNSAFASFEIGEGWNFFYNTCKLFWLYNIFHPELQSTVAFECRLEITLHESGMHLQFVHKKRE